MSSVITVRSGSGAGRPVRELLAQAVEDGVAPLHREVVAVRRLVGAGQERLVRRRRGLGGVDAEDRQAAHRPVGGEHARAAQAAAADPDVVRRQQAVVRRRRRRGGRRAGDDDARGRERRHGATRECGAHRDQ